MIQTGVVIDGKYIIEEDPNLEGGMGKIYFARHLFLGNKVVIKVVSPALLLRDPSIRERLKKEARLVAQLNHAAIVPVTDFGEYQSQPYMVMRYMGGGTLRDRLKNEEISLSQVATLINRIAMALDKAHAQQIIHRDIKPSNILFDEDGYAYLADFGIARLVDESNYFTVIGTRPYMAPEQFRGFPVDPTTDVYQLGVLLFQLLTKQFPYPAKNEYDLINQHLSAPIPRPSLINATLPICLDEVIERALAKEQRDRYAAAGEFAEALNRCLAQHQIGSNAVSELGTSVPTTKKLPTIVQGKPPLNFEWCSVPSGEFTMGGDTYSNEKPIHLVDIGSFWIARYVVTNAQYQLFVAGNGYSEKKWWTDEGVEWLQAQDKLLPRYWSDPIWNEAQQPVVGISWYEAIAFCNWASHLLEESIRLPSEAEWEKAARGKDGQIYPWGNEPPTGNVCNFNREIGRTTPIGQYSPQGDSPYRCAEMAGNVWEWTLSKYLPYPYADLNRNDKDGIEGRIVRGGSWHYGEYFMRSATRFSYYPGNSNNMLGFRCARDS